MITFDLTDTTHYQPVDAYDDPGGLRIVGENSSEAIGEVQSINGLIIDELEALQRLKSFLRKPR